MRDFLAVISFLGIGIFFIAFVVSAIMKKNYKKPAIIMGICFVLFIFALFMGNDKNDNSIITSNNTVDNTPEQHTDQSVDQDIDASEPENDIQINTVPKNYNIDENELMKILEIKRGIINELDYEEGIMSVTWYQDHVLSADGFMKDACIIATKLYETFFKFEAINEIIFYSMIDMCDQKGNISKEKVLYIRMIKENASDINYPMFYDMVREDYNSLLKIVDYYLIMPDFKEELK